MNDTNPKASEQPTEHEPSEDDGVVCTACLHVNAPRVDYCAKCGAPVNSLVAFNPFDQTLVEGFAYRRAVDGPPSKIIMIGIWVLFAPPLLVFPFFFIPPFQRLQHLSDAPTLLENGSMIGYCVISVVILYRCTKNYFVKHRTHESDPIA